MYHPAAALHQPSLKAIVERDFEKLPQLITAAADAPEYIENESESRSKPQQLSMF